MTVIMKLWKKESALVVACIVALAGVITLPGVGEKVLGVLLPLLGGGAVRQTVYTGTTVQKAVQAVAETVASQLDSKTAGNTGQISPEARKIVNDVVNAALTLSTPAVAVPAPTAPPAAPTG